MRRASFNIYFNYFGTSVNLSFIGVIDSAQFFNACKLYTENLKTYRKRFRAQYTKYDKILQQLAEEPYKVHKISRHQSESDYGNDLRAQLTYIKLLFQSFSVSKYEMEPSRCACIYTAAEPSIKWTTISTRRLRFSGHISSCQAFDSFFTVPSNENRHKSLRMRAIKRRSTLIFTIFVTFIVSFQAM